MNRKQPQIQLKISAANSYLQYVHKPVRTGTIILNSKFTRFVVNIFIIILLFSSCTRQSIQHDGLLIAVSIPPQAWFISQIAGDNADILIIVPPGQNPHNYEPAPRQLQSLAIADAWILSGSEFEIILRPKVESLFPDLLIIDGTEGVNFRLLEDHDHDDNSVTFAPRYDRHTWLGRDPAIIMAFHAARTLSLFDNENEIYYYGRYGKLINIIEDTFSELRINLAPLNGRNIFVYHPSFGYFFDEFGIIQEAVETGGKEPTPRQLNRLMEMINEEKPAAIFVQTQFPVDAAKTLAASADAQVIELDPLAQDWLENIRYMGQMLENLIPGYY